MSLQQGLWYCPRANSWVESEEEGLKLQRLMDKMLKFAPDFKGPISTEESVKAVMSVIEKSSIEAGNGGSFVSHHGNKQWI